VGAPRPGCIEIPENRVVDQFCNLVSSCIECNSQKGEKPADDFLRRLFRERQLNAAELAARLRALDDLASGKLRPSL
jgi:hypothetical protein